MKASTWLAGVALAGLAGMAHGQWRENGKPVPDTAWRKAWGSFGAMLHLTDRPDELFAAWETPGARVPVSVIETVKRGVPIAGVIFFTGCTPNAAGRCETAATFQVFKPDGTAYADEETAELWSEAPPPDGELQLGVAAIGVRIEPRDPDGTYMVRARLLDRVSNTKVELAQTFDVESCVDDDQRQ
jgi:hypothetical protein